MCYNAAHPMTWAKIFNINSEDDVIKTLYQHFDKNYQGLSNPLWFQDQILLYQNLIKYNSLKVLGRTPRRLEFENFEKHINLSDTFFFRNYDDAHFHRRYDLHRWMIKDIKNQFSGIIDEQLRNIIKKEIKVEYLKADFYKEFQLSKKLEIKKKLIEGISELKSLPGYKESDTPNISCNFFEQDLECYQ